MKTAAKVDILPMKQSDIEQVMEIEKSSFPSPWTESMFENELRRPQFCCCLVACLPKDAHLAGKLVGYVSLFYIFREGHVTNLAVRPDWRRRGIGERLLFEIVKQAQSRGVERLTLEVRESNTVASELYKKFGFFQAGKRRGYYEDTGEDALILWTDDITSYDYKNQLESIAVKLGLEENED